MAKFGLLNFFGPGNPVVYFSEVVKGIYNYSVKVKQRHECFCFEVNEFLELPQNRKNNITAPVNVC